MSAVVLHDVRAAADANACFVAVRLDVLPSFLAGATLRHVEATVRPARERSLAMWSNLFWLCSQTQSTSSVPVLQIVVDWNLDASTRSLIAAVADAAKLLAFLQNNDRHSVLRVVLRHANDAQDANDDVKRMYLLGDCLLLEATKTETVLARAAHRWFASQAGLASDAGDCALTVVWASDVDKQLVLVRGKLALPKLSLALGSLRSPAVVSLLLMHLASLPVRLAVDRGRVGAGA
ncbi:hypothetical protein SPRG_16711 [Saprolegnia parasitica CBS 223.65]|uniref:Uncharacterized protein n=1 Tax=Saprolegnia parasitica (strain CBS 223.65) TaxID=695850 RepID=A0A067BI95_SAPPC|nr:hypothetical protein SPRG_16711 [Saprolegnia parasitica CBS 223.65]KDO17883.1 hypothetical protein SPRG_16711 [Saprolegnia parasitica CBS 223.65]|eukprot:XP_012211410.1 hypothetical protein SPRG_16711 [Saprolegnia parasitica CBS 223.65]